MGVGAALGGLFGTGGTSMFGNSNKRFRKYRKEAFDQIASNRAAYGEQYKEQLPVALGEQARTLDAVNQGYDRAQGFAKKAFAGAREGVARSEERALGDMLTGLNRRGLGGISGLRTGIRRGLRSDTQLSLMQISDMLQKTQGGLAVGRGQAQAGVYGQMLQTNLMGQRNAGINRVNEQRLAFLSGLMSGGPPTASQERMQFGFDLAGTAIDAVGAFKGGG